MNHSARVPVLDGLRGISILLVLSAHMLPLGPKALKLNDAAGAMGMSLFFALSGFLITSVLHGNQNIFEFSVRRLARIIPLAYAYSIIVFSLVYYDPRAALGTMTFLINYFTSFMAGGLNNHFWSLCVELQFYIAIALAVWIGGKRALWLVWPVCLIVTATRIHEHAYIAIQTHLRVDEILSGAIIATIHLRRGSKHTCPLWAVGLAALLWFASASPYGGLLQYARPYASALLVFASINVRVGGARKILEGRVLRYIATISYALYVIHPATVHGWLNDGGVLQRYLLKRPLSFFLAGCLAHASTFYWERPWRSAADRWIQARRSQHAAAIERNV